MNAVAVDEPAGSPPPRGQEVLPPKPAEPKTVGETVADHVDELLRSIRSD